MDATRTILKTDGWTLRNSSHCEVCTNPITKVHAYGFAVHDSLITLLTRHVQTLSRHRVSLSPGDETAFVLCPEISSIVEMLQGLALLSKECKASLGQFWVMEVSSTCSKQCQS